MNKKMYLTAAEAKAMNLPSMDEQIAKHNALMEALRKERDSGYRGVVFNRRGEPVMVSVPEKA